MGDDMGPPAGLVMLANLDLAVENQDEAQTWLADRCQRLPLTKLLSSPNRRNRAISSGVRTGNICAPRVAMIVWFGSAMAPPLPL